MIDFNRAREIALTHLQTLESDSGEALSLVDPQTIEKQFGWVFFYNSRKFLESGDVLDALAGNAPFIVSRESGAVRDCVTSSPIEEYISKLDEDYTSTED